MKKISLNIITILCLITTPFVIITTIVERSTTPDANIIFIGSDKQVYAHWRTEPRENAERTKLWCRNRALAVATEINSKIRGGKCTGEDWCEKDSNHAEAIKDGLCYESPDGKTIENTPCTQMVNVKEYTPKEYLEKIEYWRKHDLSPPRW